jgi:hypothetical protein
MGDVAFQGDQEVEMAEWVIKGERQMSGRSISSLS